MRRRLLIGCLASTGVAASLLLSACGGGPAAAPAVSVATTRPTPTLAPAPTPTHAPLVGGGAQAPTRATHAGTPAGTVGTVLFARGSASVTPNGVAVVGDATAELRRRHTARVRVLGYTDYLGGERVNTSLSQQRADVVAGLLRTALGPAVTVTPVGMGKSDAEARLQTKAGPQQNRRAIILSTG